MNINLALINKINNNLIKINKINKIFIRHNKYMFNSHFKIINYNLIKINKINKNFIKYNKYKFNSHFKRIKIFRIKITITKRTNPSLNNKNSLNIIIINNSLTKSISFIKITNTNKMLIFKMVFKKTQMLINYKIIKILIKDHTKKLIKINNSMF